MTFSNTYTGNLLPVHFVLKVLTVLFSKYLIVINYSSDVGMFKMQN